MNTLASPAQRERYLAVVLAWQATDAAEGWRWPPRVGDIHPNPPETYRGTPDLSREAGPPGKDCSPWTGSGYSLEQEAAFRRGFVEIVKAALDGFTPETWQHAHLTLETIAGEIEHDAYKPLRYMADTTDAAEMEAVMNDIVINAYQNAAHWQTPEGIAEAAAYTTPAPPEPAGHDNNPEEQLKQQSEWGTFTSRLVGADSLLQRPPPISDPLIEGVFDLGDKIALLGASKSRKSFFFIQLALCLATGFDFLKLYVPTRRRILFVNLEIKEAHFQRRLTKMAKGLGISASDLAGYFDIVNARGLGISPDKLLEYVQIAAQTRRSDIVFLDPLYKLASGDENASKDMKPVLAQFDHIAEESGAAVAYSHHDAKGSPGDRDIRDRGAGSNVVGRDYDTGITLTPHRDDREAIVVELLCRNYKSPDKFVVCFDDEFCTFNRDDTLTPEELTSKPKREQPNADRWLESFEQAIDMAIESVWQKGEFTAAIQKRFKLSGVQTDKLFRAVRDDERVYTAKGPNKGVTPRHFMGEKTAVLQRIEELKAED